MPLKRGIELIVGPMFCGKTDELLRRLRRLKIAKEKVQLFKPEIDTRYSEDIRYSKNDVRTHSGSIMSGILVKNTAGLIKKYDKNAGIIGIDELQFFDYEIVDFLLKNQTKHLFIISGLPLDFRGEPFKFKNSKKHIGDLMPYTRPTYLSAICTACKKDAEDADFTQRLINGKPAPYDSPLIVIGGKESYEARCIKHFYKPIKGEENKFLVNGQIVDFSKNSF